MLPNVETHEGLMKASVNLQKLFGCSPHAVDFENAKRA